VGCRQPRHSRPELPSANASSRAAAPSLGKPPGSREPAAGKAARTPSRAGCSRAGCSAHPVPPGLQRYLNERRRARGATPEELQGLGRDGMRSRCSVGFCQWAGGWLRGRGSPFLGENPGWGLAPEQPTPQHQTLPLQPASAEPAGATSSPEPCMEQSPGEAPPEPGVSASPPAHTLLLEMQRTRFHLLPSGSFPTGGCRSGIGAHPPLLAADQRVSNSRGIKKEGRGEEILLLPFFFSFFPPVFPLRPKRQKDKPRTT